MCVRTHKPSTHYVQRPPQKKNMSKCPVKAEFVTSGCCIKTRDRLNHRHLWNLPFFCCVFISHDSNPSFSYCANKPTRFTTQLKGSRCLQSHLVAPFGNRTVVTSPARTVERHERTIKQCGCCCAMLCVHWVPFSHLFYTSSRASIVTQWAQVAPDVQTNNRPK